MTARDTIIDREMALESAGGNPELAEELFGMLLDELPGRKEEVHTFYRAHDYEQLFRTIHSLHGSATYCGVPALQSAVSVLESRLKRGEVDDIAGDIDAVNREIDRILSLAT